MIGMVALAGVSLFATLNLMQSANTTYIRAMKQNVEKNINTAKDIQKQTSALSNAKALYFKTYGVYPSSVQELIDKKMLRANYKNTLLSKNISLDASGNIKVASSNVIVSSYSNTFSKNTNSKLTQKISSSNSLNANHKVLMNNGEITTTTTTINGGNTNPVGTTNLNKLF